MFKEMNVLKKLFLALALVFGALTLGQTPSQALPLGASAQAESAAPAQIDSVQYYYYYRRPRYRYYAPRPRYYYRPRYYRPQYYYYRPRYYW